MAKRSLQKKVAILNDYITKEIERDMATEIESMEKDNLNAKNEKKFIRQNYPHHSRNHYIT